MPVDEIPRAAYSRSQTSRDEQDENHVLGDGLEEYRIGFKKGGTDGFSCRAIGLGYRERGVDVGLHGNPGGTGHPGDRS